SGLRFHESAAAPYASVCVTGGAADAGMDLAANDMAMGTSGDSAMAHDMAVPRDLTVSPGQDLTTLPDLSPLPDLTMPGTPLFSGSTDTSTGMRAMSLAVGDFDRDGKLDVAIAADNSGVDVHLGNGDGTLGAATLFGAHTAPGGV